MFHSLVNSRYFSEAARGWGANGGYYCDAPIGTRTWLEYWEEQEKRCRQGYSVGGTKITGRHYHYLNFAPITKIPDNLLLKALEERRSGRKGTVSLQTAEKIFSFPRFYEVDYEWYWFKHIAWYGGEFMGIKSPGGRHQVCAKTRGAGFSFKEAADGVYNYTFIDGSKSFYFAGLEDYLIKDGILNKVTPMLDWTNQHCEPWKKNRKIKNTPMHMRASYKDAKGIERGSFSEIIGQIVDKADKVRGKRGRKLVFEEAGSFKELERALAVALGTIKEGSTYVGQISIFGTGGEEGPGIEGLEEIFYNPEAYDMMSFPNIWDEGMEGTQCGYFVPVYRMNPLFMDEHGNADVLGALGYEQSERKKKGKSKKVKALDMYKAEYPWNPGEAFNRVKFSPFLVGEIAKQIRRVESNTAIQSTILYGMMGPDKSGKLAFNPMPRDKARPVLEYPHTQGDDVDLSGCVTIFEQPFRDQKGQVPNGLYQLVFDPYALEEADDETSLFAIYVLKNYNNYDQNFEGMPVANFVGRPSDLTSVYEQLFWLAQYYNAPVQGELPGGGQGVINHARERKLLQWLEHEPEMILGKEYTTSVKNRGYLMTLATDKKMLGLKYLVDWHKAHRGATDEGKIIRNLQKIYDVGLLREMYKFNGKRNADRISALVVGMFMLKENVLRETSAIESESTDNFYNRELYADSSGSEEYITLMG